MTSLSCLRAFGALENCRLSGIRTTLNPTLTGSLVQATASSASFSSSSDGSRDRSSGSATDGAPSTSGRPIDLRSAFVECVKTVRDHDPDNFAWVKLLSKDFKPVVMAIRALNVETAHIGDIKEANIAAIRFQWWQTALKEALSNSTGDLRYRHPVTVALNAIHRSKPLNRYWLQRLVQTREQDALSSQPPATMNALESYAEGTASAALYTSIEALGIKNRDIDHAASHLGKAHGIATLLRGTIHHAQRRRSYLPVQLCAQHKVVYEKLYRGEPQEALKDVVHEVATVAKGHLDEAVELMESKLGGAVKDAQGTSGRTSSDLTSNLRGLFLPAVGCQTFLKALERVDFDVFDPALARGSWAVPPLLLDAKMRWALWRGVA